jgi:hypothetical protein
MNFGKSLSLAFALLALPAIGPSIEVPVVAPTIARAPGTQPAAASHAEARS